jgi:hypothetical protein
MRLRIRKRDGLPSALGRTSCRFIGHPEAHV